MAKRIDGLKNGEKVTLNFHGNKQFGNDPHQLPATFDYIAGTGDARTAHFILNGDKFETYRFRGHWAYGTSAEKLSISEA